MTTEAWPLRGNPRCAISRRAKRKVGRPLRRLLVNLLISVAVVGGSAALGAEAVYWHDVSEQQPQPAGVSITSSAGWVRARHADLMQSSPMDCAPTTAAMMLSVLGVKETPKQLSALMHTNGVTGTPPENLMAAVNLLQPPARRLMWQKVSRPADLERALLVDLQAGVPVPEYVSNSEIPWHSWTPGGHVVLVDGLDQADGEVSVWDPARENGGEHSISVWMLGGMLWTSKGAPMALVDVPISG